MSIFPPPRFSHALPAEAGTPYVQREFARRVTAVAALKTAQRASPAELDALFATLQHRAFRGELQETRAASRSTSLETDWK